MRIIIIFLVIVLLPAAGVLAHDIWIAYGNNGVGPFYLSDIGWIWLEYHKESHDAFKEMVPSDLWEMIFVPILRQRAFFIALLLAVIASLVAVINREDPLARIEKKAPAKKRVPRREPSFRGGLGHRKEPSGQ